MVVRSQRLQSQLVTYAVTSTEQSECQETFCYHFFTNEMATRTTSECHKTFCCHLFTNQMATPTTSKGSQWHMRIETIHGIAHHNSFSLLETWCLNSYHFFTNEMATRSNVWMSRNILLAFLHKWKGNSHNVWMSQSILLPFLRKSNGNSHTFFNCLQSNGCNSNCISTKPLTLPCIPSSVPVRWVWVWLWLKAVRIQNINKIKYAAVLAFCTALIANNKASPRNISMAMITHHNWIARIVISKLHSSNHYTLKTTAV